MNDTINMNIQQRIFLKEFVLKKAGKRMGIHISKEDKTVLSSCSGEAAGSSVR